MARRGRPRRVALTRRGRDAVAGEESPENREAEAARGELDRAREHRLAEERERSMSERLARLHHLCRQLAEVQGAAARER